MQKQVGMDLSIVLSATLCISACKCNREKESSSSPFPTTVSDTASRTAPVQAQTPTQPTAPIALPIINEKQVWASKIIAQYPELYGLQMVKFFQRRKGMPRVRIHSQNSSTIRSSLSLTVPCCRSTV